MTYITDIKIGCKIRNANHHILRRMIEEDRTGEIIKQGETSNHSGWWVRLPYATVLLEPEQVIIQ